jgi:uncharacterized protein YkwD
LCAALGALVVPSTASAACDGENEQVTAGSIAAAERALLCLVNSYRAENGRGTLTADLALQRAARGHAEYLEQSNTLGHVGAGGSMPADRASAEGYPYGVGENAFASNFPATTPRDAFDAFRSSPGHNANMLDPTDPGTGARLVYATAGMGFAVGPNNGVTAVQVFGLRANPSTQFDPEACAAKITKLRKAKQRVSKARKQLRRADTNSEEAVAERKLKRAKRQLRKARKAKRVACPSGG